MVLSDFGYDVFDWALAARWFVLLESKAGGL